MNDEFGGKHVTILFAMNAITVYMSVPGNSVKSLTFPPISDLPHVFMIPTQ